MQAFKDGEKVGDLFKEDTETLFQKMEELFRQNAADEVRIFTELVRPKWMNRQKWKKFKRDNQNRS